MNWAFEYWHILEAKTVLLGLWSTPGGLLRIDILVLLPLIEGVLREFGEEPNKVLDEIYDEAKPKVVVKKDSTNRAAEIAKFMELTGGG